jgi:hypothetical protein
LPTPCLGQLRRLGLMSELAEEHPNVQPISARKGMVNGLNTANQVTCQFRRWNRNVDDGTYGYQRIVRCTIFQRAQSSPTETLHLNRSNILSVKYMRPTLLLRHRGSLATMPLSISPRWSFDKSDRIQKQPCRRARCQLGTLPQQNTPIKNNVHSTGATFRIPRSIPLRISMLGENPLPPAFVFQPAHQQFLEQ